MNKEWVLDDGGEAADSVTVELLRNGSVYDQVTLSEDNDWEHTWTRLSDNYNWSVAEADVPEGFTTEVSHRGTAWTITNDDIPEDPPEPDIPTEPEDPPEPDIPTDPEEPDEPTPPTPETPTDPVPQTGDETHMTLWLGLLALSGIGILAMLAVRLRYRGKRCKE